MWAVSHKPELIGFFFSLARFSLLEKDCMNWIRYQLGRRAMLLGYSFGFTSNRVFSHDVTAAILVCQNNETAAMLVSQTSPGGVELFSCANAFFCSNKFA